MRITETILKKLIFEMLLTEKVYGAQATVYHGSRLPPDKFIELFKNQSFQPGNIENQAFGAGLYCVYDLKNCKTNDGAYGSYVYKLKVNLNGFICFDFSKNLH